MGLAAVQDCVARLYTHPGFRAEFFARSIGADDLEGSEAQLVTGLSPAQVRFFARSLVRKRLNEVSDLIPETREALGSGFAPLFFTFAEDSLPAGVDKHRKDALAFCSYLQRLASRGCLQPGWAADVVRHDAARLRASMPGIRLTAGSFRRVAPTHGRADEADSLPQGTPTYRTVEVWWRLRRSSPIRHFVWSVPALPGLRNVHQSLRAIRQL